MNDKIKSSITTSYMLFVFDFSDPSGVDKSNIETLIECPLLEVFNSQKKTDSAKKILGRDGFDKMLSLFFASFQTQEGFDFEKLGQEIVKNKKVFLRHLGKDRLSYLGLLIKMMSELQEPKRGLIFGEAS